MTDENKKLSGGHRKPRTRSLEKFVGNLCAEGMKYEEDCSQSKYPREHTKDDITLRERINIRYNEPVDPKRAILYRGLRSRSLRSSSTNEDHLMSGRVSEWSGIDRPPIAPRSAFATNSKESNNDAQRPKEERFDEKNWNDNKGFDPELDRNRDVAIAPIEPTAERAERARNRRQRESLQEQEDR
jgi:hypothetical protein